MQLDHGPGCKNQCLEIQFFELRGLQVNALCLTKLGFTSEVVMAFVAQ